MLYQDCFYDAFVFFKYFQPDVYYNLQTPLINSEIAQNRDYKTSYIPKFSYISF